MENQKKEKKKKSPREKGKKKPSKSRKRSKRKLREDDTMYGISELPYDDIPVRVASEDEVEDLPFDDVPVRSLKMGDPGVPEAECPVMTKPDEKAHPPKGSGENLQDKELSCDAKASQEQKDMVKEQSDPPRVGCGGRIILPPLDRSASSSLSSNGNVAKPRKKKSRSDKVVEDLGLKQGATASTDAQIETPKEAVQSASSGPSGHRAEKEPQTVKLSSNDKVSLVLEDLEKKAEKAPAHQDLQAEESAYLKMRMKYHKLSLSLSEQKKGPVKVLKMSDTGAEESTPQATSLSTEQLATSTNSPRKVPQDNKTPCDDKVASVHDSGAEEGRKMSYDDLMKALQKERAEKAELQKALRSEECSVLKKKLNEMSSSLSKEKRRSTQLSSELQGALSHQQRAVEERDQLAAELEEVRAVCAALEVAVDTEMSETEKLSNQLLDWDRQLNEKTAELEESKTTQADLRASLHKEHEKYEKLSSEHQALLCKLQDDTRAETNQSGHLEKNQQQTSTAHGDHSDKQPCKSESTSLEPGDQKPTCGHQNLMAELQNLASKHKALLSDYQCLQADHQALQSSHQELKSNLPEKQGCTLKTATTQTKSESGGCILGSDIQATLGHLQKTSPEVEALTAQLADQQEKNGEVSSSMGQLRGTIKALIKGQDKQKADNVELQQELQQAKDQLTVTAAQNSELHQPKSDIAALKQALQREKDNTARLRKKIEERDWMILEQKKARRKTVKLNHGVTEQCLLLIKQLRSDSATLHKCLLEETDRNRAYDEETEALLAKNKEQLDAALKNVFASEREVERLKAKLTAKEKEVKDLLSDTNVHKRSLDHSTSNSLSNVKRKSTENVIMNTLVVL